MKTYSIPFILFVLIIFLKACGSTDSTVTVIEDAPRTVSVEEADDDDDFIQLRLGVIDPINNFDPLFAENLSTLRVLSLIYEGLFRFDEDGEPIPDIVREVEVSEDGLEYLFTIDREIFFHESPVFTAGLGRRIHARDIKWVLERTAKSGVPTMASELLMNVLGYENYYLEQRTVFDQQARVLDGVNGIEVINSETLLIQLNEPDDHFLNKLASPLLSIYPSEAILQGTDGLRNRAIGTGHYKLDRVENDGRIVIIRDDRGDVSNRNDQPDVNRIDFTYYSSESELFQAFARNETDWIPEFGPEITRQVLTYEFELLASYATTYELVIHPATRINTLYLYTESVVPNSWLLNRLSLLTLEDFRMMGEITLQTEAFEYQNDAEPMEEYFVSFTDDLVVRGLFSEMNTLIFQPESSLLFFDIRVPTRRTSLYNQTTDSFHNQWLPLEPGYWLRIDTKIVSLHHGHIEGIQPATVPWQLQIDQIRVLDR